MFPNFFCVIFRNWENEDKWVFEISERKNEWKELVQFIGKCEYLIGFNSIHYDNLIINYLIKNQSHASLLNWQEATGDLKDLNDLIINDKDGENYKKYSYLKYNQSWKSVDIFLYWSKLARISRKLSLKSMAVNINWYRIQDLPYSPSHNVLEAEIDTIIDYCDNDVQITKELAKTHLKEEIQLRQAAKSKYGFDCMSWDGVKLGLNVLIKRYCDRTGLDVEWVKKLRTTRRSVDIGETILPIIKFNEGDTSFREFVEEKKIIRQFNSFYGLHQYLKTLVVKDTKEINCRIIVNSVRYDVKSGGLHTYHSPEVVIPLENEIYRDVDVSSMYPTLGAMWGFIPEHLGEEFAEELDCIRQERLELKRAGKGKSEEANLLKLSLNGGYYGNTNNEYTPMFDRKAMLSITINGQLMLLMLCEQLIKIGVKIDMTNTDGVTMLYNKNLHEKVEEVLKTWEAVVKMELESVNYQKVIRMNINNYMAIYSENGKQKIKQKGIFLTSPPIDMSRDFLIIAKALEAYFINSTPIEEFIYKHQNIYDFTACQKVDRKFQVRWNNTNQQRINRYYVSKKGSYLYKVNGEKSINMLSGWAVQLFNDYIEKPFEEYEIDYSFYISETKKLLNELQPKQLCLIL